MTERSFIIDFGCCLPFGHHIHSVKLHHEQEARKGRRVVSLVCRRVRRFLKNEEGIHFVLPAPYKELLIDAESNRLKRWSRRVWSLVLYCRVGTLNLLDLSAYLATRKIFRKYAFTSEDYVPFPSADYYGVRAFVKRLAKLPEHKRPRVHFRFIGVLEHSRHTPRRGLHKLVTLINRNHSTITVGAEVPKYARYLDMVMPDISVRAEPYPLEEKAIPEKPRAKVGPAGPDDFTIFLPGTNRPDKGYFDMNRIAREIFFHFPRVRLVIQDMKRWDTDFDKKYQRKLARIANVQLVDAILPRETIEELYASAHLVFLPYDPVAYHFRGSAIHYEAVSRGIPVLARKGTGFAEEVEAWSSGWNYETIQELLERLETVSAMKPAQISRMMKQAQNQFKAST